MTDDVRSGLSRFEEYILGAWYFLDEHKLIIGPYDTEIDALVGFATYTESSNNAI